MKELLHLVILAIIVSSMAIFGWLFDNRKKYRKEEPRNDLFDNL